MKSIKSYLPIFPGFYGTIFEPMEDLEIEYWQQENENVTFEDIKFDYDEFYNDTGLYCCDFIEGLLSDFGIKITFEKIVSPKYYNFSNDSINCTYEIEDINTIKMYLIDNKDEFQDYLKERYTSRSGFISFYETSLKYWLTTYFDEIEENTHILGSVLEFILNNEHDDVERDMYDAIQGNVYLNSELI